MLDNMYESADISSKKFIEKSTKVTFFQKLLRRVVLGRRDDNPLLDPIQEMSFGQSSLQEALKNKDIEIIALSEAQRDLVDKINGATTAILKRFHVEAHPDADSLFIYRMNPTASGEKYEDIHDEQISGSFSDSNRGLVYLYERNITDENGEIDEQKLLTLYTHEVSHKYAVPHESMATTRIPRSRVRGIYLGVDARGDRIGEWIDEAATVYTSALIQKEAGLSDTSLPREKDWSETSDDLKTRFEALAANLGIFLEKTSNSVDIQTLNMLLPDSVFVFPDYSVETMKQFIVGAHLNQKIESAFVYLLHRAYSDKKSERTPDKTVWERLMEGRIIDEAELAL